MSFRRMLLVFVGLFCILRAPHSFAYPLQSLQSVRQAAVDFAAKRAKRALPTAKVVVKAADLDPRLRLSACSQKLQLSASAGSAQVGHTVVVVHCPGVNSWKLYVPVAVKARLRVLVSAGALSRGTHISAGSLNWAERDVANLPYGYFSKRSDVVGQVLTRDLAVGQVLTPGVLRPPLLVKRGQVVTLVAGNGDFSVSTQGEALEDGARGALVRVRNMRSNRVVQGTVTASGRVHVYG